MRPDRRRLIKAGFLVLSLGAAQLARGANMLAVRVGPHQTTAASRSNRTHPSKARRPSSPRRRAWRWTLKACN